MSEARSVAAPWEEDAHALVTSQVAWRRARRLETQAECAELRSAEAVTSVVKHSVPRYVARSPRLHVTSTRRKPRSEPGTHEVRVHADRTGGRSRSDASRVSSSSPTRRASRVARPGGSGESGR